MKNIAKTRGFVFAAGAVLLLVAVLLIAQGVTPAAADEAPTADAGAVITVNATGIVSVQPDKATIYVGVSAEDKDAKAAQQKANTAADALVKALKSSGIKDENLQTSDYSLYPNYDYSTQTPKIKGYIASHMYAATTLDVGKVGDIIDAAVAAGANQNNGIVFGVQDDSAQYQQALKKALDAAKPKAQALAQQSGGKLGAIVSIVESGSAQPSPYARYATETSMDSAAGMSVEAGSLDITATVTVHYTLQ